MDESQIPKPSYILGLDLGKKQDPTAFSAVERTYRLEESREGRKRLADDYVVKFLRRWPLTTKYETIISDLASLIPALKLEGALLAVDETGVGSAVVEQITSAEIPVVLRPIYVTGGHTHTREGFTWHVPKKDLVAIVDLLLQLKIPNTERRRLRIARIPEREQLQKELLDFSKRPTKAGNEVFGTWREGTHDDIMFSVSMACWLGRRCGPFFGHLDPDMVLGLNPAYDPANEQEAKALATQRAVPDPHAWERNTFVTGGHEVTFDDDGDQWSLR